MVSSALTAVTGTILHGRQCKYHSWSGNTGKDLLHPEWKPKLLVPCDTVTTPPELSQLMALNDSEKNKLWPNLRYCPGTSLKLRRMRLTWHVAHVGERRGACGVLVGKPEGNRWLGRPSRGWEDNIKMDLKEVSWGGGGMDWIDLAQDRDRWRAIVNVVTYWWVVWNVGSFLTIGEPVSFWRRTVLHGEWVSESRHLPGESDKNYRKPSQDSWRLGS